MGKGTPFQKGNKASAKVALPAPIATGQTELAADAGRDPHPRPLPDVYMWHVCVRARVCVRVHPPKHDPGLSSS